MVIIKYTASLVSDRDHILQNGFKEEILRLSEDVESARREFTDGDSRDVWSINATNYKVERAGVMRNLFVTKDHVNPIDIRLTSKGF